MSQKSQEEQSRRLIDHVVGSPVLGSPHALLATTFDLNPDFFEGDYLASLLSLPGGDERGLRNRIQLESQLARMDSMVLLTEARRYQGRPRSLRVHMTPARAGNGGVLHAKVTFIVHEDAVRLIVASANLTTSGYRENREVALSMVAEAGKPDECRILREAIRQMPDLMKNWWNDSAAKVVGMIQSRLNEWAPGIDRNEDPDDRFVWGGGEVPLWQQVANAWPTGESIRKLTVVSPFWSDEGPQGPLKRMLSALAERDADTSGASVLLVTAATPDAALTVRPTLPDSYRTFDFRTLGVSVSAVPVKPRVDDDDVGRSDVLKERELHAKVMIIEGTGTTLAYVGSANFTVPGFGFSRSNIEAGMLLRRRGKAGALLREQLIPPVEGSPRKLEGGGVPVIAVPGESTDDAPFPLFIRWAELGTSSGDPLQLSLRIGLEVIHLPENWSLAVDPEETPLMTGDSSFTDEIVEIVLNADDVRRVYRHSAIFVRWSAVADNQPVSFPVNVTAAVREKLPFGDPEVLPREGDLIAFYQGRIALEDAFPTVSEDILAVQTAGNSAMNESRIDTSRILSYQIRNFVEALPGIRDELARNTATAATMRLALLGPVSPLALAIEIERAATSGRSATAAAFQLIEILAVIRAAQQTEVREGLKTVWLQVLNEASSEIRRIFERVSTDQGGFERGSMFSTYVDAVMDASGDLLTAEVKR